MFSTLNDWLSSFRVSSRSRSTGRKKLRAGHGVPAELLEDKVLLSAGDLDPAFGVGGLQATDFTDANGFRDHGAAIEVDSQGGIVVGGGSDNSGLILRYTATGELDTSFGVDGRLLVGLFPGGITDIAILETSSGAFNGVLAIGGIVSGDDQDFGILNLDAQGNIASGWGDNGSGLVTIDFDPANGQSDTPRAIVRKGNDVYVVGDTFDAANSDTEFAVARLTADTGNVLSSRTISFDAHARVGGNFDDKAFDVAVDANNRVIVAGSVLADAAGGDEDFAVTRLNQDLTDDNTFGQEVFDFGTNEFDQAYSVAVEGTGNNISVYVGGASGGFGSGTTRQDFAIAKLLNNGDRDTSFGGGDGLVRQDMRIRAAQATDDRIGEIALQGNAIVAAGQSREDAVFNPLVDFTLGLFDKSTGNRDSFTHTSFFAYKQDAGHAMTISGTDIIVAGATGLSANRSHPEFSTGSATNVALARYDSTGQLRTSANGPEFGNEGRVVSSVADLSTTIDSARAVEARTADGKIVSAGLTQFSETFSGAVSVYNANGTLDTSFGIGGRVSVGLFNISGITDLTVLTDGSNNFDGVLLTGPVLDSGDQDFGVINLTRDGNIRSGWGDNGSGIVTVDFDAANAQSDTPRAIVRKGSNVYVVGDAKDATNQDSEFAVVRIDATTGGIIGTPQVISFDGQASVGGNFDDVAYDAAIDANDRLTIAGTVFANAAGTGQDFAVTRLNQDLTPDNSFGQEVFGFDGEDQAFTVAVEGSGTTISTYVGGFTTNGVDGLEDLALAKLLNNGDRDTSFGGGDGLIVQDIRKVAGINSNDRIAEIAILGNTIVAAGQSRQPGDTTNRQVDFALSRFDKSTGNHSGTRHTSFFAFNQDAAHALDIDTSGNIIVAGATGVTTQATAANLPLQTRRGSDSSKFVDISGTGTALNLSDDEETNITTTVGNALFPAGTVTVANNGGILAGPDHQLFASNSSLPRGNDTGLFPFWDDIDSDSGNVFFEERMVDGINTLIVQWHNRPRFSDRGNATFQVQVPQSGPVLARFAYSDTFFETGNVANNGGSATIGFQVDGKANQVSFNQPTAVFAGAFIEFLGNDAFGIGGESAPVSTNFALARYDANGNLLTSGFGNDGLVVTGFTSLSGSDDEARAVQVGSDGTIVVAGGTTFDPVFAGSFQGAVAVYNSDGSLNENFGVGGRVPIGLFDQQFQFDNEFGLTDVVILEDSSGNFDGMIVTGPVEDISSGEFNFAAMKLTKDGSIASGWGDDGSGVVTIDFDLTADQSNVPRAMALKGNDLYIAGHSVDSTNGDAEFAVVRIDATLGSITGTPRVVSFDITTGGQGTDVAYDVAVDSLGRVLLAGSTTSGDEDFAVTRLRPDLTDDNTFGQEVFDVSTGRQDRAVSIAVDDTGSLADYRVYVGGFANFPAGTDFALAKLGPNGDRDTGFGTNGIKVDDFRRTASTTSHDTIAEIQLQDGHIVVGGTSMEPASADPLRGDFATGRYQTSDGQRDNTVGGDGTVHTTFFASQFDLTGGLALSPTDGDWLQVGASGDINDNFALARFDGPNTPVVDLNGAASGIDTTASYNLTAGGAQSLGTSAATVTDADAGDMIQGATVTISTGAESEDVLAVTTSGGITSSFSGNVLTLLGTATPAAYQTVLRTLTFTTTSTSTAARTVSVAATDAGGSSGAAAEIAVSVVTGPTIAPADLDGSGGAPDPFTDGILMLAYLGGLRAPAQIQPLLSSGATVADAQAVLDRLDALTTGANAAFDVDQSGGAVDQFTDGILMLAYFLGLRQPAQIAPLVVTPPATIAAAAIVSKLDTLFAVPSATQSSATSTVFAAPASTANARVVEQVDKDAAQTQLYSISQATVTAAVSQDDTPQPTLQEALSLEPSTTPVPASASEDSYFASLLDEDELLLF